MLLAFTLLFASAGLAHAQADLVSRDTLSGVIDLRVAVADGEPSWTDGGFGKSRFGGSANGSGGSGFKGDAAVQGDLVWKPRFTWEWSGLVDLQAEPDQSRGVDLGEAFLRYKPVPRGDTRFSARAGLFYPPISLEHEGGAWIPADTITPSAINSWVGEELKVEGLEASLTHAFPGQEVSLTGAIFYYGDTAGTLLVLRGWSLSDLKSSAGQRFALPPLSPFMSRRQPPFTTPVHEIDGRAGWYLQAAWRTHGLALDALYYDNGGDRTGVDRNLEWAWDTRFWEAGATWNAGPRTTVRAQAMRGTAHMGYATPVIWIDAGYDAAYGMVTQRLGGGDRGGDALSARVDWFEVVDQAWKTADPNSEWGWAFTGAWRHPLGDHVDLLVEAMHIKSYGEARERTAFDERQEQTVIQSALRLKF